MNGKKWINRLMYSAVLGCSLFAGLVLSLIPFKPASVFAAEQFAAAFSSVASDGVSLYAIKISSVITPVIGINESYFPTSYEVTENAYGAQTATQKNMFVVSSGDTVFLASGEYLLLAFGRSGLTDKEAVFNSTTSVGGACNITHFVDGVASASNQRHEELSSDGNNFLYQYGHIFNANDIDFQEGYHQFIFDYGTISSSGEVVLGRTRQFGFYLFDKNTYNKNNDTLGGTKNVIITPNSGFTTESVQGFVSNDSFYTENFYSYTNKTTNVNKLTYPRFVFDPSKIEITIEKTFNKQVETATITSVVGQNGVYSTQTTSASSNLVRLSQIMDFGVRKTQIEFTDVGEYVLSYRYVYFNAQGIKQVLPALDSALLEDKITLFGYQMFYSIDYTGKAEFRKHNQTSETELYQEETVSVAADITYAINSSFQTNPTAFINSIYAWDKDKVVKTNQSPLKFDFAASLVLSKSKLWKTDNWENFANAGQAPSATAYDGSNILSPGKYVIELYYTYSKYKDFSTKLFSSAEHRQLFIFEITNAMPIVNIETLQTDQSGNLISDGNDNYFRDKLLQDGEFTNKPIRIVYPSVGYFDSAIRVVIDNNAPVTIYPSTNSAITYSNPIILDEGTYKKTTVMVQFGKSFGSNSLKSVTTDRVSISNIQTALLNSQRIKTAMLSSDDIIINQSFSVQWDEKLSGSKTWATYKFIPTNTSGDYLLNYPIITDGDITGISNGKYLQYSTTSSGSGTILAQTPYSNTVASSYAVSANSVLSIEGLYLFRIYDQAGNEAYYYMILDKSAPIFLQKEKTADNPELFEYVTPKALNVVSNSTIVEWGTHKAIALGLFSSSAWRAYSHGNSTGIDPWVLAFHQGVFEKGYILNTEMKISAELVVPVDFLAIPITGARVFVNKQSEVEISNYTSSFFRADVLDLDGEENEADYTFFVLDASNIASNLNNNAAFKSATKNNLKQFSSASYALRTTTDMALSTVYISNGASNSLIQKEGELADKINYTQKSVFYRASNALQLRFTFQEDIGNNIVSRVAFYYYPMVFDQNTKTQSYSPHPVELFENSHYRKVVMGSETIYVLQIPLVAGINVGQTLQGKYVIERTYQTADENIMPAEQVNAYITSKKDYVKRVFTAYIDHNPIITTPDAYGSGQSVVLVKQVGDYWKLTATDDTYGEADSEDDGKVVFKDFFRQDNSNSPIVKTNKNPVEIIIPYSMYGTRQNTQFLSGMTHSYIINDLFQPEITEFFLDITLQKLSVSGIDLVVEDLAKGVLSFNRTTGALVPNITGLASAFIAFDDNTGFWSIVIPSGDQFIGTYRILIENRLATSQISGNFAQENESFYFVIEIVSPTPSVTFTTTIPYPNGDEIASISTVNISGQTVGYTNGKNITATWTDPIDDFIIKIDTTLVSYTINGGARTYITPTSTGATVKTHSVIAKKFNAGGFEIPFAHGDEIIMYFGVVGRTEAEYVFTRKIIIDTTAPTTNLQKLIQNDSLVQATESQTKTQLLRLAGERYNRSRADGIYRYYAFALDIESNFVFEMGSVGNTSAVYYKAYANNNYTGPIHSVPGDPFQISQSNRFISLNVPFIAFNSTLKAMFGSVGANGAYYEIVEVDLAGNHTIYSIYLYSSLLATNTISSSSPLNSTIQISAPNAQNRIIRAIDVLQISEIDLSKDQWFSFELNGKSYYTSPFVKAYRTNSFLTTNASGADVYMNLAEISALLAPSKTNYTLLIRSRQLGVVEVKISIIESTRYFITQISESVVNNVNRLTLTVLKNDLTTDPNGQLGLTRVRITINNGISTVVQTVNFTLTETWQVVINNAETNVMYAFELYDNFRGTSTAQSSVRHIYGAAALVNPPFLMTDGSSDFVYNALTKTITTSKAVDFLFIEAYLKDGKRVKINEDNQGPLDAIVPETSDPIKRVTLFPSNEVNGGLKTYFITVEYHGDIIATVYTVYIFNKHAEAFLRDDSGNDKGDLFRGSVTTDPVVGTFVAGTASLTGTASNLFETKIYYRFNNGAYQLLQNPTRFTEIGTYQYLYQVLVGSKVLLSKSEYFTISKEGIATFAVRVQRGSVYDTLVPSGSYLHGNMYIPEYISNASVFRVDLNSNLFLIATTLSSPSTGLTKGTYVIRISNKNASQKPSIYFETTIAITLIEETQNILTNTANTGGATTFSYYTSGVATTPVITSDSGSYRLISTSTANSSGVTISWPTWFGTQNNRVLLTLKQNNKVILMNDNSGLINLKESGQYVFMFSDIAGNTHYFTFRQSGAYVTSNEYTIHYLASVIFLVREEGQVEGYTGVQNAVYNKPISISVPESTISTYYDVSARPEIFVERNGTRIAVTKTNNEWLLTEPGLYKVYFRAKARPTSAGSTSSWLPEVPLFFTIVNANESRWAFEFLEYEDYVVTRLDKNGVSILPLLRTNASDTTEKVRSFVLSYFDSNLTGKGRYNITIQSSPVNEFSFSVWINDGEIPIVVSVAEGTVTTNAVSVQFNMQNIYNNIGDCFVKISKINPIYINSQTLAESASEVMDISLTEKGIYFIQVFTAGGSLMYSYRIEVKEPLNAISIILIVVGSLTVGFLTFIFIKIRKKIQVK